MPFLHRMARSFKTVDPEDLVQHTLLKAWAARANFTIGTNMEAWLSTILRNAFLSRHRRLRREEPLDEGLDLAHMITQANQEHRVELADLERVIAKVPLAQRTAMTLFALDELSLSEIAELTGSRPETVKTRIFRGRAALKALLDGKRPPKT